MSSTSGLDNGDVSWLSWTRSSAGLVTAKTDFKLYHTNRLQETQQQLIAEAPNTRYPGWMAGTAHWVSSRTNCAGYASRTKEYHPMLRPEERGQSWRNQNTRVV